MLNNNKMNNNIYAVFKIHVVSKFAVPGKFMEYMKFPVGFSIHERLFEVGVVISNETINTFQESDLKQHILSIFGLDKLISAVGQCKLCNENECYEINEKECSFNLCKNDYQGNIVSKNELLEFLNGGENLNSMVKIIG